MDVTDRTILTNLKNRGELTRAELMESALNQIGEGVAVVDAVGTVVFWNKAAAEITGYGCGEMQTRRLPEALYSVDIAHRERAELAQANVEKAGTGFGGAVAGYSAVMRAGSRQEAESELLEKPTLVQMRHHKGHTLPAMLRRLALRGSGSEVRSGTVLFFHPVDDSDALPHGETLGGVGVKRSQAEMEDRLDEAHHRWVLTRMPYGLIWITVDQGAGLRKTHGRDACEAMLGTIEQALLHGLRPTETLGRWGDDEFLVLAHERSLSLLIDHAERLAGLARTAEFRWWGDRVMLTVSVGVTQASEGVTLPGMLGAAREAMQKSSAAGGNGVVAKGPPGGAGVGAGSGRRDGAEVFEGETRSTEPPAILRVRAY